MAALGLAVSSSALGGPLESEARAVCLLAAPARACGASIEAKFNASFSPPALDRREQTPVSPWVSMSFKNSDGTHPSALKEFEIEEDRQLRLNLTGVPACHGLGLQDGIPLQQKCRKSLIGTGRMVVNIQFPEQEPIVTRSKVTAYNEGVRSNGTRSLLLAAYVTVPTPAAIVTTVEVKRNDAGPYGLKLLGSVPKIAGGFGSITYLAWRFHKSIFSGTCPPDRHLDTRFTSTLVDGTKLAGTVFRNCTPAP